MSLPASRAPSIDHPDSAGTKAAVQGGTGRTLDFGQETCVPARHTAARAPTLSGLLEMFLELFYGETRGTEVPSLLRWDS